MNRRKPLLRRTPLRGRPRTLTARPPKVIDYTPTPRAIAQAAAPLPMAVPVPKRDYVRSEVLLEACRLIPCQHCEADDGTVCAAHSNWSVHGKGKSIKADDNRVASLCARCHRMIDQGSKLTEAERAAIWFRAHVRTVIELLARQLWPRAVPVPPLHPTGLPLAGSAALTEAP